MDRENISYISCGNRASSFSGLHKNGGKRREVAIGLEQWRISAVGCG